MKKILIVIHDLKIGGAQKSLISFLQGLMASEYGNNYEIHLMMAQPEGDFCSRIPKQVKIVPPSREMLWMSSHLNRQLLKHFSWRGIWGELRWIFAKRLGSSSEKWNSSQKMWTCWKNLIPENPEVYDVAISYIDGCPNYYVMEKVTAKKKVLWFHSEYQKHGYNPEFDEPFMANCDAIVTISDKCRDCLAQAFPRHISKMHVLQNITLPEEVIARSKESGATEFERNAAVKLLTVGRLHPLKGIDLAIEAAKCLKETGIPFLWLVVGDGAERPMLESMITAYGLEDCFCLIGARENPYPYMAQCDILVQPSRVEGKSIVLDEAMLLQKPVVVTNYATVKDAVIHGENGWIVEMTGQAISDGILRLWQDDALRSKITERLREMPQGNEEELNRYIELMFR